MLPFRCFSCGRLLAHIEIIYEKEIETIEGNSKTSDKEKEKEKKELVKRLCDKYCCSARTMTYVDVVSILT